MATTRRSRKTSAGARSKKKFPEKKATFRAQPASLRGKDLERAVEQFQSEPDDQKAHEQWKQIESSIFGAQLKD